MKFKTLFFALSSVLAVSTMLMPLSSCKKKKEKEETQPEISVPKPDTIVYKDLNPDISLTSSRGSTVMPGGGCTWMIPRDSSANYLLDLNSDGTPDFKITHQHSHYSNGEYCGHCPPDNFMIDITPMVTGAFISTASENGFVIRNYQVTAEIRMADYWSEQKQTIFVSQCGIYMSKMGILGLRLNDQVGWLEMEWEIMDLREKIKAFAINTTNGNSILAGQIQ